MAQVVTLSSAGTATMTLNPVSKSTTVVLTSSGGSSASSISVQFSLDDPSQFGGPASTWTLLSSAATMTSSVDISLSWTVLSPLGGVRLNSTGILASSGFFTLKALQAVTA